MQPSKAEMQFLNSYKFSLIWALVILLLCGMNASSLPHIRFNFVFDIDKLAHFMLFGMFAFLLIESRKKFREWQQPFSQLVFPAFLISSLYGVLIEILQATVFTSRSFDYHDMLANAIGAAFVSTVFYYINRRESGSSD